jgi:hypothetical protein
VHPGLVRRLGLLPVQREANAWHQVDSGSGTIVASAARRGGIDAGQ